MGAPEASDGGGRIGDPRPCVVFLHIPKTAGSTVRATLRHKYPAANLSLYSTARPLEAIEEVPLDDRRKARVVAGHLHYGVHRHMPQECEYITVLREPVARVVSSYRHILARPRHRFHDQVAGSAMGLEEFVRAGIGEVGGPADNVQTRFISGRASADLDDGALEEAKRNLERFLVVGLTERFDESFILIRRALGWKLPMYATRNVRDRPGGLEPPTREAIELIRERDWLDVELYDHARDLFAAAIDRQGSSLRREVAVFRVLNRIPSTLGPRIPAPLRHPLRSLLPR